MDTQFDTDLEAAVKNVMSLSSVKSAYRQVEDQLPQTIEVQKKLTLIEAPTGAEKNKALRYKQLLEEAGLEDVVIEENFNVYGRIPGTNSQGKAVVLEGHLDTVFSFGDVKGISTDEQGRIHCPGICDDTRALAANLAVLKAMKDNAIKPVLDVYFAGTVREEGLGGMAGMKWLLESLEKKTQVVATISIDGPTAEVFYANATGMVDWEVTFEGPGGHAWTACEKPSAIHAAGFAIAEIAKIKLPEVPKTTVTVSLVEGGQAIHGIAQKATIKINARSNSQQELDKLDTALQKAFAFGAEQENSKPRASGKITVKADRILAVPAGSQPDDARIIQLTKLVTRAVGKEPKFLPGGCTNTNMSIGKGIPAVTLGRGGEEFGTHTLAEWFNPHGVFACEQKSLLLLCVLAGVDGKQVPLGLKLK